ncbi:MAG: hypothetical protein HKN74_08955 [Acidimicrobiia bacterium]|nr:hypothetical protein [Acidimicrobiia bacterium]NNF10397.1 hypothetical protein [Acidimicrobiia bacterium]NNL71602.1 hypothetical protein [Acidimicrobiia bacterium]
MDNGHRVLHRAYVLIEADVPASEAIEDLVTFAQGNVENLRSARRRAGGETTLADPASLELIGFEPGLLQVARLRRAALGDLLDRAIASFG